MNTKTNILPNVIFILAVVVVPMFFMALASVGIDQEAIIFLVSR
jgi:hypothetical protein